MNTCVHLRDHDDHIYVINAVHKPTHRLELRRPDFLPISNNADNTQSCRDLNIINSAVSGLAECLLVFGMLNVLAFMWSVESGGGTGTFLGDFVLLSHYQAHLRCVHHARPIAGGRPTGRVKERICHQWPGIRAWHYLLSELGATATRGACESAHKSVRFAIRNKQFKPQSRRQRILRPVDMFNTRMSWRTPATVRDPQ